MTAMPPQQQVVVTAVDIPFGELVGFLFKLFFASLPVGVLVAILWYAALIFTGAA